MFTKAKFLSFSEKAQHKKIAELLKSLYHQFDFEVYQHILKLENWIGCPWTQSETLEDLSNSFHRHFKETNLGISEHDLWVKNQDRKEPLSPWLEAVIYLDRLRSAHNIGSIIRTVEAFRLGKICFSPQMPNLAHRAVQKTSMNAHSFVESFEGPIENCPQPLIVMETHKKAVPLDQVVFPKKFTLIVGNEEFGVSRSLLEKADVLVEIPLVGCKNSLNVAACFSILAWKIRLDQKN